MGRHREFDPEAALDAALEVFWSKGYEGTSYGDLSEATGVARPGLYTVFGNKEALFLKATDRYEAQYLGFMTEALGEPTAKAVVTRILFGSADAQTGRKTPKGCLGVNGAMACSEASEAIRRELVSRRQKSEKALRLRLQRAKVEGDLPADADPETLARYVMTMSQGMAVQAKAGAGREQLRRLAELVVDLFPGR
jgi:AcrR family transcriptional regulator